MHCKSSSQNRLPEALRAPPGAGSRRDAQDGAQRRPQEAPGVPQEPPSDGFGAALVAALALRVPIFEAPGQQKTKHKEERTCTPTNTFKLKTVL